MSGNVAVYGVHMFYVRACVRVLYMWRVRVLVRVCVCVYGSVTGVSVLCEYTWWRHWCVFIVCICIACACMCVCRRVCVYVPVRVYGCITGLSVLRVHTHCVCLNVCI